MHITDVSSNTLDEQDFNTKFATGMRVNQR